MKNLNYQLKTLCRQNRDGGFSTQAARSRLLAQMASQLDELGYRKMNAKSLKPKHVEALVELWKGQGISTGSLKNRLSVIRWWAGKVNKPDVVCDDNQTYGIGSRKFVAKQSRAQTLDLRNLAKIPDPYVRMSVRLKEAFGLRREEAFKFQPAFAIRDQRIYLKSSWTKGGRARSIPVTTDNQRSLLVEVRKLANTGALIPQESNYITQLRLYERLTKAAGMGQLHGLRHGYAQRRYRILTGWECAAAGGPTSKGFSRSAKTTDCAARLLISNELGHSREAITATYLGRWP